MKIIPSSSGAQRRVARACKHVSDLWFPANPQLVSRLRQTLDTATDAPGRLEETLLLVQEDFSLFMYALKEVTRLLHEEGIRIPERTLPTDLLKLGGLGRLKEIFSDVDDTLSEHLFEGMEDLQVARMREAIVSASATTHLAVAQKENKELGYFGALLRQLGLTLIAWNYPSVYQRASVAVRAGSSFDQAITEILGFSPSMLAFALAQEWQLPTGLVSVLEPGENGYDYDTLDAQLETNALGGSLRELCRIGEALARANEPEVYPSARLDWEFAKEAIAQHLGPKGLDEIRETLRDRCQHYIASSPAFFRGGLILEPEILIDRATRLGSSEKNPFIAQCRPHLQESLHQIYQNLAAEQSVQALLRALAHRTIPLAGFSGGAVFTIDPTQNELFPQLKIGKAAGHPLRSVSCDGSAQDDFIFMAFQEDSPLVRSCRGDEDLEVAQLATMFGFSQRVGVLYLEIPSVAFKGSEAQTIIHLKALATTLTDILRLG